MEETMTIDERYKYLRKMQRCYRKASRTERSIFLDEMEVITGLHRKSLIRLVKGTLTWKKRHRQRGRTYGPKVDDALRVIIKSFDYICAERLQPNLVWIATRVALRLLSSRALSSTQVQKLYHADRTTYLNKFTNKHR